MYEIRQSNHQIVQIANQQNPEISINHNTLSVTVPSATRAMSKAQKHAAILVIILLPRFILFSMAHPILTAYLYPDNFLAVLQTQIKMLHILGHGATPV